jgi:hypothetical protein
MTLEGLGPAGPPPAPDRLKSFRAREETPRRSATPRKRSDEIATARHKARHSLSPACSRSASSGDPRGGRQAASRDRKPSPPTDPRVWEIGLHDSLAESIYSATPHTEQQFGPYRHGLCSLLLRIGEQREEASGMRPFKIRGARTTFAISALLCILAAPALCDDRPWKQEHSHALDAQFIASDDDFSSRQRQPEPQLHTHEIHGLEYSRSLNSSLGRRFVFSIQGPLVADRAPGLAFEIRF